MKTNKSHSTALKYADFAMSSCKAFQKQIAQKKTAPAWQRNTFVHLAGDYNLNLYKYTA